MAGFFLGTGIGFLLGTEATRFFGFSPLYAASDAFQLSYQMLTFALIGRPGSFGRGQLPAHALGDHPRPGGRAAGSLSGVSAPPLTPLSLLPHSPLLQTPPQSRATMMPVNMQPNV